MRRLLPRARLALLLVERGIVLELRSQNVEEMTSPERFLPHGPFPSRQVSGERSPEQV